jgi:hypothetical protein
VTATSVVSAASVVSAPAVEVGAAAVPVGAAPVPAAPVPAAPVPAAAVPAAATAINSWRHDDAAAPAIRDARAINVTVVSGSAATGSQRYH